MNLFPDIEPDAWQPEYERYQERERAPRFLQINSYDPVTQFFARGRWEFADRTEYDQLEDHWDAYAAAAFSLFDFYLRKQRGLYVATADGVATTYTLPAKAVVTPTVKHNGVAAATQPTLSAGTGLEGRDQIVYAAGTEPAAGVVVTLDAADARRAYDVNYGNVRFVPSHQEANLWLVELEFVQRMTA